MMRAALNSKASPRPVTTSLIHIPAQPSPTEPPADRDSLRTQPLVADDIGFSELLAAKPRTAFRKKGKSKHGKQGQKNSPVTHPESCRT